MLGLHGCFWPSSELDSKSVLMLHCLQGNAGMSKHIHMRSSIEMTMLHSTFIVHAIPHAQGCCQLFQVAVLSL